MTPSATVPGEARPAGLEGLPEVPRGGRGGGRWALPVVAAFLVLVGAGLASRPVVGIPGDPRSTTYGGLRGILDVAEELERQVDISVDPPADGTTTYLLIRDDLSPEERDEVRAWVAAGGRLVVTDPGSPLTGTQVEGGLITDVFGATSFEAGCDLLPGVGRVRSAAWTVLVPPSGEAEVCVRLGDQGAWLVRQPSGDGEVIALGGPGPLANEHLDAEDNALAGVAILAPDVGDRVLVRPLPAPGTGDEGLLDLLPRRVRHLLVALAAVYGVLVWWRARRHGPPVPEPLPLRVPGSAIVEGVAGLLQRTGDREAVASGLRRDLSAGLRVELGLGRDDLPADELAALASERLGLDAGAVSAALSDEVATDDDLLTLARRCAGLHASIRRRHASPVGGAAGPTLQRPGADRGADT